MKQTHTYAILELSKVAVDEISDKLREAGYDHAFHDGVVDMHGIAVSYEAKDRHPWKEIYRGAAVKQCEACGIQRLGERWRKPIIPGRRVDRPRLVQRTVPLLQGLSVRAAVLTTAVALSACTHSDRIAVLTASAAALTYCDVRQTLAVSGGGRWDRPAADGYLYYEMNPLLGPKPSAGKLVGGLMLVESGVLWVAATDKIPTWGKYVLLGALAAGEAYEVSRLTKVAGVCGDRD